MAERLCRKALYDLVWSEPMKNLAARFGVSDVGLKKTCERAAVPTPYQGYWAKKERGKETFQVALPARPPGMDDEVSVGGQRNNRYGSWSQEEVLAPIGPPPEFTESIETVRARIAQTIGHVTVSHTVRSWHPAVERLLKEDEKRREKQAAAPHPMSWDNPLFDTTFERRRLRILNSLFFAVAKMNGKPSVDRRGRDILISFFQQHFHLKLDRPKVSNRQRQSLNTTESRDTKLCLSILTAWGSESVLVSWQDDDVQMLESRMTDIAVQLILTAEIHYREGALRHHQWLVQRKAELEEEERKRKLEAERKEKERQKRIEQGRIDRLLRDATAFQQAAAIRQYVEAIRLAQAHDATVASDELEQWRQWALAQANRIDPALACRFLHAMQDEEA